MVSMPERLVFDAEPLLAHADDEPGGDVTETYLDAVANGEIDAELTRINATEIRYVLARKRDTSVADRYLRWLEDIGVTPADAGGLWADAAHWVLSHNPSLADAYALAAAERANATLLVGADGDFDGVEGVTIERIRDDGV